MCNKMAHKKLYIFNFIKYKDAIAVRYLSSNKILFFFFYNLKAEIQSLEEDQIKWLVVCNKIIYIYIPTHEK